MTQKIDYRLPLILIGGLIFQLLFWDEFLGINLSLYTLFILAITFTDQDIPFHKNKLYTALPHLAIAIYISYNNSLLAIITWFITLLVYLGTTHFVMLKSTFTAMIWGVLQTISGPSGVFTKLRATKLGEFNFKLILKPIKYIVLPVLMVVIFCSLYSLANPIFDKYIRLITDHIDYFFKTIINFLFIDISLFKCLFILLGVFITAGMIVSVKSNLLEDIEIKETDDLKRDRRDSKDPSLFQDLRVLFVGNQMKKKLALKTENIVGIISFAMLNLLLLFLNGIDVATLWFNNVLDTNKNLSAELHDGTNTLIFSIVIAMVIIVYFFTGNLNFYSKNKWIKLLAYIWIVQNAFLVLSVFHRDYDYISHHGLTYKRIGVAVFATLSLVGLATVYLKVAKQKTVFFLYRINAKIWYTLLVLLSFVNWDVIIVSYNLSQTDKIQIDIDHLLSFSDKTLPLLEKNRAKLAKYVTASAENSSTYETAAEVVSNTTAGISVVSPADTIATTTPLTDVQIKANAIANTKQNFNLTLDKRIKWFLEDQKKGSWLSFSYLKWEAAEHMKISSK